MFRIFLRRFVFDENSCVGQHVTVLVAEPLQLIVEVDVGVPVRGRPLFALVLMGRRRVVGVGLHLELVEPLRSRPAQEVGGELEAVRVVRSGGGARKDRVVDSRDRKLRDVALTVFDLHVMEAIKAEEGDEKTGEKSSYTSSNSLGSFFGALFAGSSGWE